MATPLTIDENFNHMFPVKYNIYTDLEMCSYVWLGQLNVWTKYGVVSDKNIRCIG